jgi:rhodanese-related sulfurtransferase
MTPADPSSLSALLARAPRELDVIDVRAEAAFAAGHLAGSGHIPLPELEARRSELPPPGRSVIAIGANEVEARAAASALVGMGWPEEAVACAWPGSEDLERDPARWVTGPPARLWRPAPFLEVALARFRGSVPQGPAADIAAGAGRDAVWLALQGFEVEAWDYDAKALANAVSLAARYGVPLRTVLCDLEHDASALPESRFALLTCFRFLHRALLPRLAAALLPGGVLIYETYRIGQERFGRPKNRRYLLDNGELAAAFAGLEILFSEEPDPSEGPITSRLVARRS